jgi:hypothetical protein
MLRITPRSSKHAGIIKSYPDNAVMPIESSTPRQSNYAKTIKPRQDNQIMPDSIGPHAGIITQTTPRYVNHAKREAVQRDRKAQADTN